MSHLESLTEEAERKKKKLGRPFAKIPREFLWRPLKQSLLFFRRLGGFRVTMLGMILGNSRGTKQSRLSIPPAEMKKNRDDSATLAGISLAENVADREVLKP